MLKENKDMIFKNILVEKRQFTPRYIKILIIILSILFAFVLNGIILGILGLNPLKVYGKMISSSFLNIRGIRSAVNAGLPLIFTGISVSIALKMNLNNIGAEGQYAMGAIVGGWFALFGPKLNPPFNFIVMFILCAIGGMLPALAAALLKAYWNINETITTLMFNYIILLYMDYLCYGSWMAKGQTIPITKLIPQNLNLPYISNVNISYGIFIAAAVAIVILLIFRCTTFGYQVKVIKNSARSAEYAGIPVKRNILLILSLSGAIAGIAGFVGITGIMHRVQAQMPNGSGYTGIVIAYLSKFNPIMVIITAILFGGLDNSCSIVQIMGVPSQIAKMIEASILIFVIAGDFFATHKIQILREKEE